MAIRITQIPIETSIAPTDGHIRITQIPVEISIAPSDGAIRVTQIAIETSISITVVHQLVNFDTDAEYQLAMLPYKGIQQNPDDFATVPIQTVIVDDISNQFFMPVFDAFKQMDDAFIFVKKKQPRIFISS